MWVILLTNIDDNADVDVVGPYPTEAEARRVLAEDVPTQDGWDNFVGRVQQMVPSNPAEW